MLKKLFFSLTLAAVLCTALAACNTLEGIGRDTQAAGDAITGAAHKTKSY